MFESAEDEVDPERAPGQLSGLLDDPRDLSERAVGASKDTEATRVRDGSRKRGTGSEPEPNRQDRILDPELAAKWRPELDSHEPIMTATALSAAVGRNPQRQVEWAHLGSNQ